jgi:hypothetical protein
MKRIGIITFHESINYGAILQTYALQKYLKGLGYCTEVINYRNSQRTIKNIKYYRKIIHYFWHKLFKILLVGRTRQLKTIKFIKDNIKLSKNTYYSAAQLFENPPIYDAYITGSDQVWNPKNTGADSSYFLDFAPSAKIKISYAPSFGVSILEDTYKGKYRNWLGLIDKLSVREEEGRKIIKEIANREAIVTLDPTFLLSKSQWGSIAVSCKCKKNYVLCYYMPGDKEVNNFISIIAKIIASYNNWDIVSIGQKEYMKLVPGNKKIFDAGPSEFIGLFKNASFILTNSFHGTAFSIIFNKPFYVPINTKLSSEKILSSRISSLLKKLKLEDRLLSKDNKIKIKDIKDIDYHEANRLLSYEIEKSKMFLKNALLKV